MLALVIWVLVTATTTTPARTSSPIGEWKVSDYISRTQDYGVIETFTDKNTPEEQLKAITKILVPSGNDSKDNKEPVKVNYSPEFDWKNYTYTELTKALGIDAADSWAKAYGIEKAASVLSTGLGIVGIFSPINSIIKAGAKGTAFVAEKYKEKMVKEYINSSYFSDKHTNFELEYELSGDYDSYSDINYGPSYGNEYKEGTVFDAEDEEDYSIPVSTPIHSSQGSNNNNNGNQQNNNAGGAQLGSGMTTGQHAAFRN